MSEVALWLCGESRSIGDAMSALLSLHFFSTLHTTQNQKRCLKVVSKFCKIKKQTQL